MGSSDAFAFGQAIRSTLEITKNNVNGQIKEELEKMKEFREADLITKIKRSLHID